MSDRWLMDKESWLSITSSMMFWWLFLCNCRKRNLGRDYIKKWFLKRYKILDSFGCYLGRHYRPGSCLSADCCFSWLAWYLEKWLGYPHCNRYCIFLPCREVDFWFRSSSCCIFAFACGCWWCTWFNNSCFVLPARWDKAWMACIFFLDELYYLSCIESQV